MMTSPRGNAFRTTGPWMGELHRCSPHTGPVIPMLWISMNRWTNSRVTCTFRLRDANQFESECSQVPFNFAPVWHDIEHNISITPRWRHRMETFSALLVLCYGNPPVTGWFPSQRPVMRSFNIYFDDLRLNKRLSKQSWKRWFETWSRSLWRHCNDGNSEILKRRNTPHHSSLIEVVSYRD